MFGNSEVDTFLFADDQAILSNSVSGLQMDVHLSSRISKDFGLRNSTLKNEVMAFHGADPIRATFVVGGTVLEQVSNCCRWYCSGAGQ